MSESNFNKWLRKSSIDVRMLTPYAMHALRKAFKAGVVCEKRKNDARTLSNIRHYDDCTY